MGFGDLCNTGLGLGLGLGVHDDDECDQNCMKTRDYHRERQEQRNWKEEDASKCNKVYPSLSLGPPDHMDDHEIEAAATKTSTESGNYNLQAIQQHHSSPSAASSFSNSSSIKRERELEFDGEVETKLPNSRVGDVDEDGNPRKKLRLTKEQSAVLEDSFKHHSTLNPKQKQELASKLNLRARQVEVWFQNRRARTKLKQTEVDCELLKKCCETLTEENKRLQKELQELKSMKTTPQGAFYMQLPAATLTICPSCERICGGSGGGGATPNGSPATTAFLIGSKAHHLYKSNYPFTHSSAAC